MNQTKLESLLEVSITTAIKYLISLMAWLFVIEPVFDIKLGVGNAMVVNAFFTALSVMVSYLMRRFFNAELHKGIHKWVMQLKSRHIIS